MRAFVAIELPGEVKDYLYDLQNRFKKELRNDIIKISWVAKKNLHLTIKFLGEINEKKLEEIKERLIKIDFKPFELNIEEIGFFPSEEYLRVLFVSLHPEEKVVKLQRMIDEELLDISSKDQEFHAHVTLGRMKSVRDRERLKEVVLIDMEKIKFRVIEFVLMKSQLSRDGPKYFLLESFKGKS